MDPAFILKSLAFALLAALLCAWITLCVIYSRTQWQIVLHPSRAIGQLPDQVGLNYVPVHFDPGPSGEPQLDGWWIPSDNPADPTVLLLHSGEGNMGNALPLAHMLHDVNLNVFLFDYRGFGRSAGGHPTQAFMQADAEAAYRYLLETQKVPPSSLAVYGQGSAAALAVRLCEAHPSIPALILQNPDGDFAARAAQDPRSRAVPAGLLFHEIFPLAEPLRTLITPKLLISTGTSQVPPMLREAANPKMTVELPATDPDALSATLTRFLSTYVATPKPPDSLQ